MGAVNIFLGGTGKAVAEDIQDSRDFYPEFRDAISDPIAFDLDVTVRDGVRLDIIAPGDLATRGVKQLAAQWSTQDPGPGVGPEPNAGLPGPRLAAERSLLVNVGRGISANPEPGAGLYALRAHGLAVFSLLFDESRQIAGAGAGTKLRNRIASAVENQTFGGLLPRINLVTSTAGGTGAGTVIPLALWLRKEYPHSPLNLIAVTASAFTKVLSGNPTMRDRAAKGRSGTYAMLRELAFLSEQTDGQAQFSTRSLPVTDGGLEYRPGRPIFRRVYWFGGRRGGSPEDAFEEAGALLRLLSHDNSADRLDGQGGSDPMRLVGAITAIEYPKLRYQRRMISAVLQRAYRDLRESPQDYEGATQEETTLLAYAANGPGGLGGWFHDHRHDAFAPGTAMGVDLSAADDLASRIRTPAQASGGYERVPRGTEVQVGVEGDNYGADSIGWRRYVGRVKDRLDLEADGRQRGLQRALREMRREEELAFDGWLKQELEQRLGPDGSDATTDVLQLLAGLDANATELQQRVGRDGFFGSELTLDQSDTRIREATDKFDNPPRAAAEPSGLDRWIPGGLGAVALLAVLGIGQAIPGRGLAGIGTEWVAWGLALAAMFVTYRSARWWMMRGKAEGASIETQRQRAEADLFAAYEQRDRVRALQWMHQELRGHDGALSFFGELRQQIDSARTAVGDLEAVYKELESLATYDVSQAGESPPHVAAEVGDCVPHDPDLASSIGGKMRERLRIEARANTKPRVLELTLRLVPGDADGDTFAPVVGAVGPILQALRDTEQAGLEDAKRIANRWRESVWNLINVELGQRLPDDFSDALAQCADRDAGKASSTLASKLLSLELPRAPSVELQTAAAAPAVRGVFVGSTAIGAEFNLALRAPEMAPNMAALRSYGEPQIVPALGQQIVFLDLWVDPGDQPWAPGVIGSATEIRTAMETYYGAEAGAPAVATARETCFTVLPELLAATKIELNGDIEALAPVVIARLLGSDLNTQGPTYAELFYLLRHRGWLSSSVDVTGPAAREVTTIAGISGGPLRLADWQRGGLSDAVFGNGRMTIVAFDAFCELMRFKGTPGIAGTASADGFAFPGATIFAADWQRERERVATLQAAIVHEWYEGDIEADCAAMIALLEQDLERMPDGEARSSWERAMRRLLAGVERRDIRDRHIDRPGPQGSGA